MRWYQFQLRKPKRWARRAKSDGSAVPKVRYVRVANQSTFLVVTKWMFIVHVPLMLVYGLAVTFYFRLSQQWIAGVFPAMFSTRAAIIVIALSFTLQVSFFLWMVVMATYTCRFKGKHARIAISHRCHLCPRCGYPLQSRTDDTQPCPECGQRISRREAVRLWTRFCG